MAVCRVELLGLESKSLIRYLAHGFIVFAIVTGFLQGFFKIQPRYGRFYNSEVGSSRPLALNPKLAWFLQESPSFFIPLALLITDLRCRVSTGHHDYILILFMVHYFQRSFVYPLLIKGGKPSSLNTTVGAFVFCLVNGFMQSYYLVCIADYPQSYFSDPRFIIGLTIFVTGFVINVKCDSSLRNLRKSGEIGYKIPTGGLFELVSCANFFGEIVEWWGFAIVSWGYPAFAFAVFSSFFLASKAYLTHRFYLEKFDDYPKTRKMILPFIL